jgi:hypothetical protein
MEAAIDRMMPEMIDLAFVDLIRDHHRAALTHGKMGPGDLMRLRLADRHAGSLPAPDPGRIREMASIDMVEEYSPEMTLEIRADSFEGGSDGARPGEFASSADLEAFLATPGGMEMVSGMSQSQFNALTQLLRELKAEEQLITGDSGRTVGDGTDLALRGWRVDHDGTDVRVYHETTPGSGLIAETGMVMGEFGRVMDIRISGPDVAIVFETGETLESRGSDLLADGIPALGEDLSRTSAAPATAPAPVREPVGEIIVTRRTDEVASLPENGGAPVTSLRPKARPAVPN